MWIFLAVLFFVLASFHAYLATLPNLQVTIPEHTIASKGAFAPAKEASLELVRLLNQEISSAINAFIISYNKNSRLANVFGACGYAVAGITSIFCLVLKKKTP